MHILLNTHSPYFLRAIQVYSAKYATGDKRNYYLSEIADNGFAYIRDVTDEINKIIEESPILGVNGRDRAFLIGLTYFQFFCMVSSISSTVLGVMADKFSHPVSVTRQLSSSLNPIPHSS